MVVNTSDDPILQKLSMFVSFSVKKKTVILIWNDCKIDWIDFGMTLSGVHLRKVPSVLTFRSPSLLKLKNYDPGSFLQFRRPKTKRAEERHTSRSTSQRLPRVVESTNVQRRWWKSFPLVSTEKSSHDVEKKIMDVGHTECTVFLKWELKYGHRSPISTWIIKFSPGFG